MPIRQQSIIIEIDESRRKELIELYLPKYLEVAKEYKSLRRILEQCGYDFNPQPRIIKKIDEDYNIEWTWIEKLKYVLSSGRLSFSEITKKIGELEPEKDKQIITRSASSILSSNSKTEDALFRKIVNERNEFMYELNDARSDYDFL